MVNKESLIWNNVNDNRIFILGLTTVRLKREAELLFAVEENFETSLYACTGWLRECHKRINTQHYSALHLLSQDRKSPFMSISGMKEHFRKEEGAFTFKIAAPFTTRPHLPVPIERVGLTDRSVLSWTQSTTTGENTRAAKVHELHIQI